MVTENAYFKKHSPERRFLKTPFAVLRLEHLMDENGGFWKQLCHSVGF